jgi:hypothetical protein
MVGQGRVGHGRARQGITCDGKTSHLVTKHVQYRNANQIDFGCVQLFHDVCDGFLSCVYQIHKVTKIILKLEHPCFPDRPPICQLRRQVPPTMDNASPLFWRHVRVQDILRVHHHVVHICEILTSIYPHTKHASCMNSILYGQ